MTLKRKEELLNAVSALMACGVKEEDCYELAECIGKAYDFDLYAWHDLREDPEDLPGRIICASRLVMFAWYDEDDCVWYDCGRFYDKNGEKYFSNNESWFPIGKSSYHAFAWRYILPMEDDRK